MGFLVLLSLVLITLSFRSDTLDPVQGFGASVLRPFEIAANRVARPFQDAASWASGLVHAKSENKRLKAENRQLRLEAAKAKAAQSMNTDLMKQLGYLGAPTFPKDFSAVSAAVLTNPTTFDQSVTIAAGSKQGIQVDDVVVSGGALVGKVTKVFGNTSLVMLISDASSAVRAVDASHRSSIGMLKQGSSPDSLVLTDIGKDKRVNEGDTVMTAGSPGGSDLPSIFPRNILIGTVSSAHQNDTDISKHVQVQPFVDLTSLQSVLVLVPKLPGTTR